ncbi:MAG: Farnesyl diphosphate synthase [Phycisphaerales bacterium]|nr:Farnesyl diphosphate synthase [Phycisphaerales bacterium]
MPRALREAIEYSLLGGGKRLRPLLAWVCSQAVGGRGEASLCAGAAVELVHAFSLVHDDLPAMDDDDLRRGRPTLHVRAGEAMAILAGDAMLALAFHALLESPDASLAVRLCRELSVGTEGMIAGQVYDTLGGLPETATGREKLELIHRNKTGALIRAACRMGAACGGAADDSAAMASITGYADAVGLMFQIVDDVLDVTKSSGEIGKRTHKDAQAGKLTYPGVLGLDESRRAVAELEARAIGAVAPLGAAAAGLIELAREMAKREK